MSVASAAAGIKVGVLIDFVMPPKPGEPWQTTEDFVNALRLRFDETHKEGLIDRPVELVVREAEGLPRGAAHAVVAATRSLVEEGCVAIIGPLVSENTPAVKKYLETEGHVPAITWAGTDDWLGEWTFSLSNGSLPDEPFVLAKLLSRNGYHRIAVTYEESMIGLQYLSFFRKAARVEGLEIVGEAALAQVEVDAVPAMRKLQPYAPDAILHLGFGLGAMRINAALAELDWDPPKWMGTSWEDGFVDDRIRQAFLGWIGLEQYDENNSVAESFLDRFEKKYGRRPLYFVPGFGHDMANAVSHALAEARPVWPQGVKDGLERVKMLPAASGSAGTRISFGKWTRRGWMGAGYLVARQYDRDDASKTHFRGRL